MTAQVYPTDYRLLLQDGIARRQADVLDVLSRRLPDGFRVYHGLHWSRLEHGLTVTGQLQFLVLAPHGLVILMSMKTGLIRQDASGLSKSQGSHTVHVFTELCEQRDLLTAKFHRQHHLDLPVEFCFYCPDHLLKSELGLAGLEDRVVDATAREDLPEFLVSLAQLHAHNTHAVDVEQVHRFLTNALNLVPEVGAWSATSEEYVTRLSQGLEQWVARLQFEPFRLRVKGTAGSGKSQLALRELQKASQQKLRSLYVCYNRPLASHVARQMRIDQGLGVSVFNFHALCDRVLKDAGIQVDYKQPGAFDRLVEDTLAQPESKRWMFDVIVVDEGQDFDEGWLRVLQGMSHARTRWIWLEDFAQNLYAKPQVQLQGWVDLTLNVNYRNPLRIVKALDDFRALFALANKADYDVDAACPLEGLPVECFAYADDASLLTQTAKAVTQCLKQGFAREQVVVLSLRGFEKSSVLHQTEIGPHSLSHFTGQYDAQGNQTFTKGSVLAESVYRFKGQSAQAVVVCELDFEEWSEKEYRKLFVAMTRAKLYLILVCKQGTAIKLAGASNLALHDA
ncbi:MAG TPA: ATP-binding domain-containing protein [Limnobacter sp.]|uniref:ATP-binding domain-containing protein n=1 Tax=Limnobacter sp. TaxID=2003368 RepID=UPI002E37A543|nr:ATP-binding domain-containing protein [Limnobacter sp.]HEX5487362.1 ATP-binding domain-containing protein [Limnobacter sp.]